MLFEDCYDVIHKEIKKRRGRWTLSALNWIDFEDVTQIILAHIHKKWDLYNPEKPLLPWVNRVISSQINNLIRYNYTNYTRPCLRCPAAEGDDLCSIYQVQCASCPLYNNWLKRRKTAYDVRLPLSLEHHSQEVSEKFDSNMDILKTADNIHNYIKPKLKENEWKVYKYLYIDNLPEEQLGEFLGYKTTESNCRPGYKQIKNIKNKIISIVKKALYRGDIEIV